MKKILLLVGIPLLLIGVTTTFVFANKGDETKEIKTVKTEQKPKVEGTSYTEASVDPVETTPPATNSQVKSTPAAPKPQVVTPPAPVQTPPKPDRSAYIAACESAKRAHMDSYPIIKEQARVNHESRLAAIHSDWASRGMANSGPAQAAKEAENQRYQGELALLESQYQQKLAAYVCV